MNTILLVQSIAGHHYCILPHGHRARAWVSAANTDIRALFASVRREALLPEPSIAARSRKRTPR